MGLSLRQPQIQVNRTGKLREKSPSQV